MDNSDKSYVTLEQHLCEVCAHPYDTGSLLLDSRLRKRFKHHTITAQKGLCATCGARAAEGYIAMVVVSNDHYNSTLKQSDANRTGEIIHVKRDAWTRLFNVPAPDSKLPLVFIDTEAAEKIHSLIPRD